MKFLLLLSRHIDRLTRGLGHAVVWLTLVMVLISTYNAIGGFAGRLWHHQLTSNALQELSWYLFSLLFLFGGVWTLKEHAHVKVDIFFEKFQPRTRAAITTAAMVLLVIPFAITMVVTCWPFVAESLRTWEKSPDPGGLPRWPLKLCVPVAFAWLGLQGLAEAIKAAAHFRDAKPEARS